MAKAFWLGMGCLAAGQTMYRHYLGDEPNTQFYNLLMLLCFIIAKQHDT